MPNVGHGFATIWEIGTTNLVSPKRFPLGDSAMATFNRDGRQFVAANDEGFTYVFDAATGEPASGRISHDECICWTSFAPDGKSIATASWDGTARIWDAVTGLSRTIPMRHDGPLLHEAFSPDGLELVTASKDWTARVWDAHSGLALTDPLRHKGPVVRAKFSPDGRWIATASFDHTARVWDKETGLAISEAFTHDDRVNTVEFSPNGKHLLTASSDGTARIWPLLSVNEVAPLWLMELAEALGGQRMNDEGKLETVPIDKVLEIRATQNNSRDTDVFSRWARWFFADPSTRPASPLDSRDDPAAR